MALNNPDTEDWASPVLGSLVAFRFTGFATSEVIAEAEVLADVDADVLADVDADVLALVDADVLA
ncbi:TPA: hypothetical protein ACGO2S_000795, partial [Streptococcus suis]